MKLTRIFSSTKKPGALNIKKRQKSLFPIGQLFNTVIVSQIDFIGLGIPEKLRRPLQPNLSLNQDPVVFVKQEFHLRSLLHKIAL